MNGYRRTASQALFVMAAMASVPVIYAPPAFAKSERHKSKRRRSRFEIRGR